MKINILDLIDFEEVNKLLEGFNQSTGFVTAILDLDGNVLSKSGWRRICTDFHRINSETSKNCGKSDTVLANRLGKDEKYHFYECLNGLIDVAVPIVIKGEHIANLFSGQFFFKKPDKVIFKKQAKKYGFDETDYLSAFEEVPIVSKEEVKNAMDFLLSMTHLISKITLQKLEQVQLKEAFIKSEEKYRLISNNTEDWIYWILPEGELKYISPACEKITGYTPEEFYSNPELNKNIIYKEDQEKFNLHTQKVSSNETPHHMEFRIMTKSGEIRWISHNCSPIYNDDGEYMGRRGTNRNITERKKKEEQLYESEFRFSKLYENVPFGMVITDKGYRFKNANPAFCNIMGYTEEEIQKMTFKDITHPEDLVKDLPNIQKLMSKELTVYKTEKRYIRKDGQLIWGALTVTSTFGKEGQFLYNLAIVEDITRRKDAEEKIIQLNERISTATRSSQVGIWDWDIKNNVLTWDEQMYTLYGIQKEEFSAAFEAWVNGLHPEDREFSENETQLALLGKKEYDTEFRVIWPDGTIHHIKAKGEVFRNEKGEPVRMIGINLDITAQKKIEKKIHEKDLEFRKLSANMPDMIFQFTRKPDGAYCIPISSEGIRNIFGCTPEEVIEDFTPVGKVILAEDLDRVKRDIEYSAAHMTYFSCEFRVQIPGKEIQWISSNSTPEKLQDGSITWYGFNVDITQRKMAEEELIKSEEQYRTLFEKMLNGFAYCQMIFEEEKAVDFIYLNVNNAFELLTGIRNVKGKKVSEVIPGIQKSDPELIETYGRVAKTGKSETFEMHVKSLNDWYSVSVYCPKKGYFVAIFDVITERKLASQTLKESEEKFRKAFFTNADAITITQLDTGKFVSVNHGFTQIFGFEEEAVLGKTTIGTNIWQNSEERNKFVYELKTKGNVENFEAKLCTGSGKKIDGLISAVYIEIDGVSHILSTTKDITKRKQIEEALKYNEALLREVGQIAKVGGWEFNPQTGFSSWTEQVAIIHDLDPDTPASVSLSLDYYTEQSRPIIEKAFGDVVKLAIPYDLELEIVTAKKKRKWIRTIGRPVVENGIIVKVQGSFQDITERKQIEIALRESESKFRRILESTPLPLCYIDKNGLITFRNDRFLKVFGYTAGEIPSLTEWWIKAYPDEEYRKVVIKNWESAIFQVTQTNPDIEPELYHITCKNGELLEIIVSGTTINENYLITFVDITDRKRAEEEIIKLNETLEQRVSDRTIQLVEANNEMEAFSYSVSHDLRAPLRHINGYVDLLNERFYENLPEKAQHYLATITDAATQMGALIDDLLQFSRIGRQELSSAKFNMKALVEEVVEKIKPDVKNRKINWSVEELPDVFGDYSLLKQVWVNLLENAVKYSKYTELAEIAIGFSDENEDFIFLVRDNGIGFDMDYAHKLFGVFQRLHSKTDFEGTGIGLANVQRIVQKHKGRVWAEAQLNKGATFYFSLPKNKEVIK